MNSTIGPEANYRNMVNGLRGFGSAILLVNTIGLIRLFVSSQGDAFSRIDFGALLISLLIGVLFLKIQDPVLNAMYGVFVLARTVVDMTSLEPLSWWVILFRIVWAGIFFGYFRLHQKTVTDYFIAKHGNLATARLHEANYDHFFDRATTVTGALSFLAVCILLPLARVLDDTTRLWWVTAVDFAILSGMLAFSMFVALVIARRPVRDAAYGGLGGALAVVLFTGVVLVNRRTSPVDVESADVAPNITQSPTVMPTPRSDITSFYLQRDLQMLTSISIENNMLVVGIKVPHGNEVYVYSRSNSGEWTQAAQLLPDQSAEDFGRTLAIAGETIAVEASDSINVFQHESNVWKTNCF